MYLSKIIFYSHIYIFRWIVDLENQNIIKNQIIGNCLLNASFLIYAGPFSLEYREKLIFHDWYSHIIDLELPIDLSIELEKELIDEKVIYE